MRSGYVSIELCGSLTSFGDLPDVIWDLPDVFYSWRESNEVFRTIHVGKDFPWLLHLRFAQRQQDLGAGHAPVRCLPEGQQTECSDPQPSTCCDLRARRAALRTSGAQCGPLKHPSR